MSLVWSIVIESLSWIELRGLNEDSALIKTVKQLKVDDREQFEEARHYIYETVRRLNALDFLIDMALSPRNMGDLKVGLRSFLRFYTYLVHYGGGSLSRAHELVAYTRGILGKNDFEEVKDVPDMIPLLSIPFDEVSTVQRFAYKYFHPSWYVSYLFNEFGENKTRNLIRYTEYPDYLRLNTLKAGTSSLDHLFDEGYQLRAVPKLSHTYRILDGDGLTGTAGYNNGDFIIQDKASILVGEVAAPKPGDLVLDVCAAPGIKTSHMAQMMENKGRIISVDDDKRRLVSWRKIMDQLGVECAESINADATKNDKLPEIEADLVTVDPPCTSTGLFHKTPSNKWRLTEQSTETMAEIQKKILWNSAQRLKDGGSLVYSTCSITVEENEGVVQSLLDRDPSYRLVEPSIRIGEPGLRGMKEAQRLYPYKHECNGFFVAKLVKGI